MMGNKISALFDARGGVKTCHQFPKSCFRELKVLTMISTGEDEKG